MKFMKIAIILFSMATAVVLYMNKGFVTTMIVGEKAQAKAEIGKTLNPAKADENI